MLLQSKDGSSIVEILDIQELINPVSDIVKGQNQLGEEEQDPINYKKENLVFPSGESLPRCWVDANYRN
ncbi:acetyltransferase [Brunnivagina elsteri]|uniref:Acetyltransferase n=1 Tax=Brunnivagina elsteri CCALA 953 TaxID=987040 RepID=A0A2A2TBX9_9CYAN|nr:acetyltransferase [Calothrix elsteri]PAX51250.1 acetyltransferase [Calothrix elsteri CCALA 953]